jgi:hypothetical protein
MTAVTEKQLGKGTRYPANLYTTTEKMNLYAAVQKYYNQVSWSNNSDLGYFTACMDVSTKYEESSSVGPVNKK